jgi:hypothetical protein
VAERPSPRTLVLLYAADLFFRLRWEILPALGDGKCVVAAPYVETGLALGVVAGLPSQWVQEAFRFAPMANERFHMNGAASVRPGAPVSGFVEFCSDVLNRDLRPGFAEYFRQLERRGACQTF